MSEIPRLGAGGSWIPTQGLVLAFALAGAGCGSSPGRAPSPPAPTDAAALDALYLARVDSARARFTDADAEFVASMILHHAQAIMMAELAPTRADGAPIRTLAARIVNAQRDEIDWMEQWLDDRGLSAPGPGGASHREHMPGMISPERLVDLERARGRTFDQLFLTLMIDHHRGAITMVRALLDTPGAAQHPETSKLASDIHADQTTEIARMEQMLAQLPSRGSR